MLVRQPYERTLLLFFVLLEMAACKEEKQTASNPLTEPTTSVPEISVPAPVHDFGVLHVGNRVSHVFKIKNSGAADLVIKYAVGS